MVKKFMTKEYINVIAMFIAMFMLGMVAEPMWFNGMVSQAIALSIVNIGMCINLYFRIVSVPKSGLCF